MNGDAGKKFPPESLELRKLDSFNQREVHIAKLSPAGVVDFTGRIVKQGVCISQADFGDLLIDACVVDPFSVLKDIFVLGGNVEEVVMELMAASVIVNPSLHPRKRLFVKEGVVISSSSAPKGFSPLAATTCWDFPLRTIKYTEDSFLQLSDLEKKGHKIVYWKQRSFYLAIKTFNPIEIDMLFGFKNQLTPMYYRKLIGCYGISQYHYIMSLLDLLEPDSSLEHIKELYALVVQQNPSLIMGRDSKLPMDMDDSVSLELKNRILEDIENYIESSSEDDNEEEDNGEKKVLTTETGREKKSTQKVQKVTFESIKTQDIMSLDKRIKAQVFGQDEAVEKLVNAIKRAKVGLTDGSKPITTALLTGQTGSGKTHLAKILCDELIKDKNALIRIDCSEYGLEHEAMKLVGSPPSFVGYEDGGYLTNKIIKYPFCVVLFDEIEKAHPRLYDMLLQVFDDARLTDGKGNTVHFNQAVIIMTSNLGSRELDKEFGVVPALGFGTDNGKPKIENSDKIVSQQLKRHFKPEFINRIDEVIVFHPLSHDTSKKIAVSELGKLRKLIMKKGYKIGFDESVVDYLLSKGFSKEYGARPLIRVIKKNITDKLADELLVSGLANIEKVIISAVDGELVFTKIEKSADEPSTVDMLEKLVSQ